MSGVPDIRRRGGLPIIRKGKLEGAILVRAVRERMSRTKTARGLESMHQQKTGNYSAAFAANVSITAMFGSSSLRRLCRSCK